MSPFRFGFPRIERRELGDAGSRAGQVAADPLRLSSRRHPGSLRHHLRYTRTRVVFGQPIGRFQRVQDHCVDISINLDMARWATYEAIWRHRQRLDARAGAHGSESDGQRRLLSWDELRPHGLGPTGNHYSHPMMAHSVLAHTLYQYLARPDIHKKLMMDALYPRA